MSSTSSLAAVVIRAGDIHSAVARTLITALNTELSRLYPEPGANHFRLDAEEVAPGRGAFLVAYLQDKPVGCGAIRRIEDGVGELKRMYVDVAARGRGVGRAILAALETEARQLGLRRVVLETGVRQAAALALYRNAGFHEFRAFGEYADEPLSVFLAKEL
jgi:GNAT superfamily N-acetyltransferase